MTEEEIKQKEEELTKKEAELTEKEASIAKREEDVNNIVSDLKAEFEKKLEDQKAEFDQRLKDREEMIKQLTGGRKKPETAPSFIEEMNKKRELQNKKW